MSEVIGQYVKEHLKLDLISCPLFDYIFEQIL